MINKNGPRYRVYTAWITTFQGDVFRLVRETANSIGDAPGKARGVAVSNIS
jgi:hypothetical protein